MRSTEQNEVVRLRTRNIMERYGTSISFIAEKTGFPQTKILYWFSGIRDMRIYNLAAVEKVLNEIEGVEEVSTETAIRNAVEPYLNRNLTVEDKKPLVEAFNELGLTRTNGRNVGWTSVKQELYNLGYKVEDKKSGGMRWVVISKGEPNNDI